jgi:hypothetical protein
MALSLYYIKDLSPLCITWVNSGRVMGTYVQKNNLLIWCLVKILKHAINVKTFGLLREISVGLLL